MDPNLSISGQTPQEDSQQTKEINLNFPNLSRINVLLLETKISEEDDAVEKSYSPSKYFGKRPSFEYKNLIKIERTTQRALSAVQKKLDETEKTPPNKAYDEESSSQQELENSKVHFSAHILEEEKDVISSPSINSKIVKKPKKSILKKSNYNEDINIDKIFIQDINQDYIDKLLLESGKEGKHFSEKITKSFVDYWKSLSHEHGIRFLQGIYVENLQYIFKDGIEFNTLLTMIETLKLFFESNMSLTYDYLRFFPTIKKFDIVVSCLLPKEKGEISLLIEKLITNKIIDDKEKEELNKVYFL